MGLEKIVAKVVADSKAREQEIISGAEQERTSLLQEAERKKAEILASFNRKADEAIAAMRVREEAGTEIEVKKRLLSTRRQILDSSFQTVLDHFANLPESGKRNIYSAMTARLVQEFRSGTIHCRKGEERHFSGLAGFKVGQSIDTTGGFLAENADGSLVIDMRFEIILKELWDRHLAEISGLLFQSGDVQ